VKRLRQKRNRFPDEDLYQMLLAPECLVKKILPDISSSQIQQLSGYVNLLRLYGEKINLVSRADRSRLWENHLFPSIVAVRLLEFPTSARLIDVGSGGGLPAIPLKIVRPDLEVVLVESSRKKTAFLKKVIREMKLSKIQALHIHLIPEDQSFPHRRSFDIMTVRALAAFKALLPMARMLLKSSGFLLAWKGETDLLELDKLANHGTLGHLEYQVPDEFYSFSEKFISLRLLKIWFDNQLE
jgi:16S rRNA (guanine527-N7)-methyltransferase